MIKQAVARASSTKPLRWMGGVLSRCERAADTLRVVTYHRVAEAGECPDLSPASLSASPSRFEDQLDYLARHYHIVTIDEVIAAWYSDKSLPARSLLITFDDAYQDFADHAWPRLRERRLPVVLFVPTAYPDQPERTFWWDRLYHAIVTTQQSRFKSPENRLVSISTPAQCEQLFRQWVDHFKQVDHEMTLQTVAEICESLDAGPSVNRVLGWRELRRLAEEGVVIAPHTQTHPLMNRISTEQAEREILGSIEDIRREIGDPPPVFAYPSGATDDSLAVPLRRAGIKVAFTVRRGVNHSGVTSPLQLRRNNIGRNTTPVMLSARWVRFSLIRSQQNKRAAHGTSRAWQIDGDNQSRSKAKVWKV